MILERRVQIGLGQMPGVAGFGKKAQIRQFQHFHQLRLFLKVFLPGAFAKRGMHQQQAQ